MRLKVEHRLNLSPTVALLLELWYHSFTLGVMYPFLSCYRFKLFEASEVLSWGKSSFYDDGMP